MVDREVAARTVGVMTAALVLVAVVVVVVVVYREGITTFEHGKQFEMT